MSDESTTDTNEDTEATNAWYGYVPDVPDFRDFKLTLADVGGASLNTPTNFSLQSGFPMPPWDQGPLGSCTAHAVAGAITFDQQKQSIPPSMPSRLFQYYNSRKLEGTTSSDAGATIRDSIKAYNQCGECPEKDWPYAIAKYAKKPTAKSYTDALKHRPVTYRRVNQTQNDIQVAIAGGLPIVFGFSVYESFESDAVATNGVVPMPSPDEAMVGGHAVVACGYDANFVLCRNSWGEDWGAKGYFTLPWPYILNGDMAADFWVVESIR